jgi:hypothetical protein
MEFVAIHYDQGGNVYLERVEAKDEEDAFDLVERNDTNIILMSRSKFDVLRSMPLPEALGQMVLVND